MSVGKRLQGDQLCQLTAQNLGVAAEVVNVALSCLLILGEVTTLEESIRVGGRVHVEVGRSVQFNDDSTKFGAVTFRILEKDILDGAEVVLDLIASLIVVDIVSHGALFRRVEDDKVHRVLSHTRPLADAERSAGQVVNHYAFVSKQQRQQSPEQVVYLRTLPCPPWSPPSIIEPYGIKPVRPI